MAENIKVKLPYNIENKFLPLFHPFLQYHIEKLSPQIRKNVFVTFSGLCVDGKGLIKDSHHDNAIQHNDYLRDVMFHYEKCEKDKNMLISPDPTKVYLVIHHPWYNYYHWLCEAIFRLWMVKDKLDQLILVLPDYYEKSDFIMGSLEPFKVPNIFFIPYGKSLYIKHLCLPPIKPIVDSYDYKQMHEIRDFFKTYVLDQKKLVIDLGDRIYLSRKKAGRKHVINEEAVIDILKGYNFTILNNEDYNFLEQVSIYSHANYLISIHGSGLTNMMFMTENSTILEFLKPKTNELERPSFVFWYQAESLHFTYLAQMCSADKPNEDYFTGDFFVDTDLLQKNLSFMFDNLKTR